MKKSAIIAIVVSIVVVFTIAVIVLVSIINFANKEKVSISASEFENRMSQKGLRIIDLSIELAQYDYIKQAYAAKGDNGGYQIEFYELINEEYAVLFYNNNANKFKSMVSSSSVSVESNVDGKNYSEYTLSQNGKYKVVSRINNTVIYIDVNSEYEKNVKDILKEIGY